MRLFKKDHSKCPECTGTFGKWEDEAYNLSVKPPNFTGDMYFQHSVQYRQLRHCGNCGLLQVRHPQYQQ